MPIPFTTQAGLHLSSLGDSQDGSVWGNVEFYDGQTFSVSGTLAVPSGATNFLPPFFYPVYSGLTVTLDSVTYMVRSGSATIDVEQNGTGIGGLTAISVTTTPTTTSPTSVTSVAHLDKFAPVITAVSSADGLSLTFVFLVLA